MDVWKRSAACLVPLKSASSPFKQQHGFWIYIWPHDLSAEDPDRQVYVSSFPVGQRSQNSTLHVEPSCQPSSLPFHHTHRSTALRRGKKGDLQSPSLCPCPREQLLLPKAILRLHVGTATKGNNFFLCGRTMLKISNITHSLNSTVNIKGSS